MKRVFRSIAELLFAIWCVVVIICLSVEITVLFRPIYYFDIERLDIPATSGYSADQCKRNYDALIDYNLIGGPDKLEFPDFEMSKEGEIHFEEVKRIFVAAQWISMIGMLLFVGRTAFCIKLRKRLVRGSEEDKPAHLAYVAGSIGWIHATVMIAMLTASVVLAAVVVDWQWAFATMHSLLFNNDYWMFNPETDPIIKILPDKFFMHCGFLIIGTVMAMVISLTIIFRWLRNKDKALGLRK